MKLSSQYNRASIIVTISVLLVGAIVYYFAINYIATGQLDRDLLEEIDEVNDYININHKLPKQVDFDEEQTTFEPTPVTSLQRLFF